MGFFSWDCKACGHPLLSHHVTVPVNRWMERGVALLEDGTRLIGVYDGYGCLDGAEIPERIKKGKDARGFPTETSLPPSIYHHACWIVAGEPGHSGPSKSARDQGFFFDPGTHEMPEPRLDAAAVGARRERAMNFLRVLTDNAWQPGEVLEPEEVVRRAAAVKAAKEGVTAADVQAILREAGIIDAQGKRVKRGPRA